MGEKPIPKDGQIRAKGGVRLHVECHSSHLGINDCCAHAHSETVF